MQSEGGRCDSVPLSEKFCKVTGTLETALVRDFYNTVAALSKEMHGHSKPVLLKILGGCQAQYLFEIPLAFTFAYTGLLCQLCHADGFLVMAMEVIQHSLYTLHQKRGPGLPLL